MAIVLSSPSSTLTPQISKSILARLLASENITIVHENVPTASFDLKSRVLRLPKWANASRELYDMLVGHEVSHALHTPQGEWISGMERIEAATGYSKMMSKTYMNIVEDARIERLIKAKFPGLKRDFYLGYEALLEKQIFGDISKPSAMCLGDRLNLHFKVGIHGGMKIPFSASELPFIKAMDETKTFEEVIALTIEILLSLPQNSDQPQTPDEPEGEKVDEQDGEGEGEDGKGEGNPLEGNPDSKGEGKGESKDGEGEEGKGKDGKPENGEKSEGAQGKSQQGSEGSVGKSRTGNHEEIPQTNEAMDKGIEEKISKPQEGSAVPPSILRVKCPPAHKCVVSYKTILKDVRAEVTCLRNQDQNSVNQVSKALLPIQVPAYRAAAIAMASAFNRKKSADIFKRSNIAKTGNLDTLRMNQYRWTDDVFRRVTKVSEGKNHGICILLDWSSSMSGIMQSTIGQLLILTDFCRLVGIPFEVYAFTDNVYHSPSGSPTKFNADGTEVNERYEAEKLFAASYKKDEVSLHPISLLNFLSSSMSKVDYEFGKSFLYNCSCVKYQLPSGGNFSYGGTPTVSALYEMSHLIGEFRARTNVQVCHTVILTDGEAGDAARINHTEMTSKGAITPNGFGSQYRTAGVMDDSITGMSYDIQRLSKTCSKGYRTPGMTDWQFGSVALPENTMNLDVWIACDIIRRRTQSQIHWIALREGSTNVRPENYRMDAKGFNWKRDGFMRGTAAGFDSVTVVNADKFHTSNSKYVPQAKAAIVSVSLSKNQLQKSFVESQCEAGGLKMVASIIGDRIGTS
jgi:hypothetical protein